MSKIIPDWEWQSDFARYYYEDGRAEGRFEGHKEMILKVVDARFGATPGPTFFKARKRIVEADPEELHRYTEGILSAKKLNELARAVTWRSKPRLDPTA